MLSGHNANFCTVLYVTGEASLGNLSVRLYLDAVNKKAKCNTSLFCGFASVNRLSELLAQRFAGDQVILEQQRFIRLNMLWIWVDTIDRAYRHTGGLVIMAHAFGTQVWIYLVDLLAHSDRLVGTLRLTHVTVNAAIIYQ